MYIKRLLGIVCLVCVLAIPAGAAVSAQDLTGRHWEQSSSAEKLSFLYGACSVVAIEKVSAEKSGQAPTLFVSKWMNAFDGKTLPQIEQEISNWYAAHPADKDRQVFEVIWYGLIAPQNEK